MGAIFQASSFTLPSEPSVSLPDLPFHFLEFFALGLLTARMVAPDAKKGPILRSFLQAFCIILIFGLLDEFYQGFVPGRNPDWVDLLVDASGGLLGILAYPLLFTGPSESS
jgi:VanZ family protein